MLQRLAPERQILGVEQSADKCLLCQHCYLAGDSVSFTCANPIRGNIGMECRAIVVSPSLYPDLRGEPTWLEGMLKSNPEGVELLFPPAKGNVKLMFTVGGREVAIPSTGAVIQMQAQSLDETDSEGSVGCAVRVAGHTAGPAHSAVALHQRCEYAPPADSSGGASAVGAAAV